MSERMDSSSPIGSVSEDVDDGKDVGIVMCLSKPIVNFDNVNFSHVKSLYLNDFSGIELPDWMDFDVTYLFSISAKGIPHNTSGSNQLPYNFILPFQFSNQGSPGY